MEVILFVERQHFRRKPDVVQADRERVRRFHYTAARNAHVKTAMTKRLDNKVVFNCRPQHGLVKISKYLTLSRKKEQNQKLMSPQVPLSFALPHRVDEAPVTLKSFEESSQSVKKKRVLITK